MGKRCCIEGCGKTATPTRSLHKFPKDQTRCSQWAQFANKQYSRNLHGYICSDHFEPAVFTNYRKVLMGGSEKLTLDDFAVPTVKNTSHSKTNTPTPIEARSYRKQVVKWVCENTQHNQCQYTFLTPSIQPSADTCFIFQKIERKSSPCMKDASTNFKPMQVSKKTQVAVPEHVRCISTRTRGTRSSQTTH